MDHFKTVFLESVHLMYCHAKSILDKEDDVMALLKEVYLLADDAKVADVHVKEWMVKQIYTLGCGRFRKKKAREAEVIELNEHEYEIQKGIDVEQTKEIICETLSELPDLYQATLFAFYYDGYTVKEVAAVTGYSEGVVLNRLNYVHKYLSEKLEDYQEEYKTKVQFSVEIVYKALKMWAEATKMDETVAGILYTSLCMELNLPLDNLDEEAEESETKEQEVETTDHGLEAVKEELRAHSVKSGWDKKQKFFLGLIVCGLAILALVAVLIIGKGSKKEKNNDDKPVAEQQDKDTKDEPESDDMVTDIAGDTDDTDSEYILPNSNTQKLTRDDLKGLTKEELRLARNEIFARHGMIFGATDLAEYFGSKSWYEPKVSFDEFYDVADMTELEEANAVLISKVEEEME